MNSRSYDGRPCEPGGARLRFPPVLSDAELAARYGEPSLQPRQSGSHPIDERHSSERLTVPTDWTWQVDERQPARAHPRPRRRLPLAAVVLLFTGGAGGFAWYSLVEIDRGRSLRLAGSEFRAAAGETYAKIKGWFE